MPASLTISKQARQTRRAANCAFVVGAVAVCLYGGLLRFDALVANYGWMGQPRWSTFLEQRVVPVVRQLRPSSIVWGPIANPYVGGDPINYLRYAREMRHFYQAHVREPMFLALTRTFLWLSGGRDIALSYASAAGSTLAILATCLLGAALGSRTAGIAAGLALATEFEAISWSMQGWRDDTFMMFVTFAAVSLLTMHRRPSTGAGVLAGLACAGACLTRVSAVSFVAPALLWIAALTPVDRRPQARQAAGIAGIVTALLVAPYLINCWRETGDALYALNYHTRYYRAAEGQPPDESVGALEYVWSHLASRPVATIDTAARGLVSVPLVNKWTGWTVWHGAVGPVLKWAAIAGLLMSLWTGAGRLLLVILLTSLLPYAITWSVGGGAEWRFTQHAYPIYLVMAFSAIGTVLRLAGALARNGVQVLRVPRQRVVQAAVLAAALALGWMAYEVAPVLMVPEALADEGSTTIYAGERDGWFFEGAWSEPVRDTGNVTVRIAQSEVVGMRVLLAEAEYLLTIRMDPPLTSDPSRQPRVTVFVNHQPLGMLTLTRDAERMGSYRFRVPRALVSRWTRIELLASHTVTAQEAGPPFASLGPETPVAFRLWYVRMEKIQGMD
jgi:hypothetical protein